MDEKQLDSTVVETENTPSADYNDPSQSLRQIISCVLLGVVFVAVAMLIHMLAKDTSSLVTEAQKLAYPLGMGLLISMLAVVWLYYQTLRPDNKKEPGAWFFPVLTGIISLIIAILAYICVGMWPVGEKSAMIVDMHHQYTPMLSQLRDMLTEGGSALYSFEIGTGASFIPMFAYYLASPLNAILVFFPQHLLTEGILVITLLKMAMMGAFMALAMQYIFKRRSFALVAIGVMYAFMMYTLAYSWNIMWLDCVMFLPLVVMGFEHMMRTGKYLMYVLTLAYTLYANYYIGFMICIFLVIYYVAFFFRAKRGTYKQGIGFVRFAIGSLLGGGLAAFILVPAFLSLSGTSAAGGEMPDFALNFDFFELLGRSLFNMEPTIRSGNLPNVGCGVLAILTLPIFATMSSIPLRRRLAYIGILLVMAASLVINQLDLLWHGMHSPNDLPYRFSFLYSFALLLIAYEVLCRIKDIKPVQICASVFGIGVYLVILEHFDKANLQPTKTYTEFNLNISLFVSFALVLVYALVMLLVSQKKMMMQAACALIAVVVVAETAFNAGMTLNWLNNNEHYTSHDGYLDNTKAETVEELVAQMQAYGDSQMNGDFYRMEFAPDHTLVDTAMFDYRGMKIFASTGSYHMTRFMGSLGYEVNGVNSQMYRDFTPTADALLSLRYIALDKMYDDHPYLKYVKTVQSPDKQYTYYIYENTTVLPIGYMASSNIKQWSENYYDTEKERSKDEFYYNPIKTQNSFYKALTGTTEDVLDCVQIETSSAGVDVTGETSFTFKTSSVGKFKAKTEKEGMLMIYVDCRSANRDNGISVSVSNGGGSYSVTPYQPRMINAGELPVGTEVTVTIKASECSGNVFVATVNEEIFKRDVAMLNDEAFKVTSFNDSYMEGVVNAKTAGVLCTSIEYNDGWTVKVDGQKVETIAVGHALLGFEVGAGEHTITLSFMPKGLLPGVIISVFSLVALVFVMDYVKRRDTGKGFLPFMNRKKNVVEGTDDQ